MGKNAKCFQAGQLRRRQGCRTATFLPQMKWVCCYLVVSVMVPGPGCWELPAGKLFFYGARTAEVQIIIFRGREESGRS